MLAHCTLNVNGSSWLAINLQRCISLSNCNTFDGIKQISSGFSEGDLMCWQANKLLAQCMHTIPVKGGRATKRYELISPSLSSYAFYYRWQRSIHSAILAARLLLNMFFALFLFLSIQLCIHFLERCVYRVM